MHDRMGWLDLSRWHLDIDQHLIPYLPAPPWRWLPRSVSRMLGYREGPPKALGNVIVALWSLLGVFCGVALVGAVSMHVPSFRDRHAPVIITSFGAAAVLEFCAIDSPLAQPRNAFLSQVFATVIGVGITKLFALSPNAQSYQELAGALACAITTAAMVLTNTVHPPAGATALTAVVQASELGWFLIPDMLLGTVFMLAAALLLNNIQRRYPMYWWTPLSVVRKVPADIEKVCPEKEVPGTCDSPPQSRNITSSSSTNSTISHTNESPQLVIGQGKILSIPENLSLTEAEEDLLEKISNRI